jgi:hypothetical protein
MNLLSTLRVALCLLAITGMIGSSLARSAMAMTPEMQAMHSDAMADHAAMEMSQAMPCCPNGTPQPDSMKDCPFMTLCLAKIVFAPGPAASVSGPLSFVSMAWTSGGAYVRDLSQPPPSRPPIV